MTKQTKIDWRIVVTGLVCLTAAEIFALSQGINGTIFSVFVLIVGAAIGITIPNPLKK